MKNANKTATNYLLLFTVWPSLLPTFLYPNFFCLNFFPIIFPKKFPLTMWEFHWCYEVLFSATYYVQCKRVTQDVIIDNYSKASFSRCSCMNQFILPWEKQYSSWTRQWKAYPVTASPTPVGYSQIPFLLRHYLMLITEV